MSRGLACCLNTNAAVRVTTFDSAESHKKWMAQNVDALLTKKEFPLRIIGGTTPDLQTCDRGKNKPFKLAAREDQEEQDHYGGWKMGKNG